jgi:hypothetical protein
MSRSFKKTPRAGGNKSKFYKAYSNRRLRRRKVDDEEAELTNNSYKKYNNSWDICDCEITRLTFEEYWDEIVRICIMLECALPSKEKAYKDYYKTYKRK